MTDGLLEISLIVKRRPVGFLKYKKKNVDKKSDLGIRGHVRHPRGRTSSIRRNSEDSRSEFRV